MHLRSGSCPTLSHSTRSVDGVGFAWLATALEIDASDLLSVGVECDHSSQAVNRDGAAEEEHLVGVSGVSSLKL